MEGKLRWASVSDGRAQVLEDNQELFAAGSCSEGFNSDRPAVMHDATMERRWGDVTLVFVEVQIRSGLSVPVELGGGPIGTLDLYAADPRGWDDTEIIAAQAYAGMVASLLLAGAKAELSGALAERHPPATSRSGHSRSRSAAANRGRVPWRPRGLGLATVRRSTRV
jgi:hypothetical protein